MGGPPLGTPPTAFSLFISLFLTTLFSLVSRQLAAPGSTGPVPTTTSVPIDGGASLLLAGGVAYGLRQRCAR